MRLKTISYLSAPIHIWWDITNRCNFNCKHCYSRSNNTYTEELTTNEAFKLIDELKKMKVGYAYILGGEPFMRSDFNAILDRFSKHNLSVMVNTNGWFMNKDWAHRLTNSTVKHLRFSLDGSNAEIHDRFRGISGSFERVVEGITNCRTAGLHHISCSFTITKENISDIKSTARLLHKLGVNSVQFGPISSTGRACDYPDLFLDAYDTRRAANTITECIKLYGNEMNIYSVDGTLDKPCTQCVKKGYVKPDFMGCTAGRTCLAVDWEGKVIPCLLWRDQVAGDLRKNSLQEIWDNSKLFKSLRYHRGRDYPECRECPYGDICARECPLSPSQKSRDGDKRKRRIQSLEKDRKGLSAACQPNSCGIK